MGLEISDSQHKRVQKIERLREYFGAERPEVFEWKHSDEELDFSIMSNEAIAEYLSKNP